MNDEPQPTLLDAAALSFLGQQTILLGLLMLSIGLVFGIEFVTQAYVSDVAAQQVGVMGTSFEYPEWVGQVTIIRNGAVASALLSLTGLLYLDYTHE